MKTGSPFHRIPEDLLKDGKKGILKGCQKVFSKKAKGIFKDGQGSSQRRSKGLPENGQKFFS